MPNTLPPPTKQRQASNETDIAQGRLATEHCAPSISVLVSVVVDELLESYRQVVCRSLEPHDLSVILEIPYQEACLLIYNSEALPGLRTMLQVARFLKLKSGQFAGLEYLYEPGGALNADNKIEDNAVSTSDVWDSKLFIQCAQCANKVFAKYKIVPDRKLATELIDNIYGYSFPYKEGKPCEDFADWCVSYYALRNGYPYPS
jgi:hypothetical protein